VSEPARARGPAVRVPHPIELESYAILRSRLDTGDLPPLTRAVVERVVHTTADPSWAGELVCDENALQAGREALLAGAPLITDVRMVAAGVTGRAATVALDLAAEIAGDARAVDLTRHDEAAGVAAVPTNADAAGVAAVPMSAGAAAPARSAAATPARPVAAAHVGSQGMPRSTAGTHVGVADAVAPGPGVTHAGAEQAVIRPTATQPGTAPLTRSAGGIRAAVRRHPVGAVWVIGNAPTALDELVRCAAAGLVRTPLVIGLPVGFVGAVAAKASLRASRLPAISNRSERGGAAVAAAAVNALLYAGETR
jgi:precorrin isomerase